MVIVGLVDAGLIVSVNACVALPEALSATCTVKLAAPAVVGVPLIVPVVELSARPAGRAPPVTDQLYGLVPPVAVSVCEYGVLTVPLGSGDVVVICRAEPAELMVRVYA